MPGKPLPEQHSMGLVIEINARYPGYPVWLDSVLFGRQGCRVYNRRIEVTIRISGANLFFHSRFPLFGFIGWSVHICLLPEITETMVARDQPCLWVPVLAFDIFRLRQCEENWVLTERPGVSGGNDDVIICDQEWC